MGELKIQKESNIVSGIDLNSLMRIKIEILEKSKKLESLYKDMEPLFEKLDGYSPYDLTSKVNYKRYELTCEKWVDKFIWRKLVKFFELQKYMLCTEYEKAITQIESGKAPVFNLENAAAWISDLKERIRDNVIDMCKRVCDTIINSTYYTKDNGMWRKKKRNNNGIDGNFIITTRDYERLSIYYDGRPTITDDLEKICYILDCKKPPETNIIHQARDLKTNHVECPYFAVTFRRNGNTHYKIYPDTLRRLNKIGLNGNLIGEDVWIKVFDKE